MQLDKHTRREKLLIKLRDERSKVWEEQRKNPYVPVTPYRWGWMVHAYLRSDALNRWDAPYMLEALKICTRPYHTTDVETVRAARAGNSSSLGKRYSKKRARAMRAQARRYLKIDRAIRKSYLYWKGKLNADHRILREENIVPSKHSITEEQYNSLSTEVKKFFGVDLQYKDEQGHYTWYKDIYRCNIDRYLMRARVEPFWVTKIWAPDPELASKDEWLKRQEEKLEYAGYSRYWFDYSSSYPRSKMRTQTRIQIRKYLKGEVEDIEIPESPREYDY